MAVIRNISTLKNIISNILNEEYSNIALNEITSKEAKEKYYKNIDDKLYRTIIRLDPTYNAKKDIIGSYTKWLFRPDNLAKLKNTREEDFYKIEDELSKFHKLKITNKLPKELRDINKFNLDKLSEYIFNNYSEEESQSKSQEIKNIKGEIEKYDFPEWTVIVPKTEEASCYYGKGTRWCTAATKSNNKFDSYNSRGKLWILINKKDPTKKYQLHFEDGMFMDVMDREYSLSEILNSDDKLFTFFTEKYPMEILEYAIKNGDSELFSDVFKKNEFSEDQKHDLITKILDDFGYCNHSPYNYLDMLNDIGDLSTYEIRKNEDSDYARSIRCLTKNEYGDEESVVWYTALFIRKFGGINNFDDIDLLYSIVYHDNPNIFINLIVELNAAKLFKKYVAYNNLKDKFDSNIEMMLVISDLKEKFNSYPVIENRVARIEIKNIDFENKTFNINLGLKNDKGQIVKEYSGYIDYNNIYNYIANYKLMMDGKVSIKPLV